MNWIKKKLGEVLIIERGGSPRPIDKYLTNSPDGINWIKISDATASDKYIYETKEKITKDGLHKTRVVNEGDFILSNSMSFGRPYIMKTTGCIHDGWLVLKQNGKQIFETEFLYYLLSSPYVFHQFNLKAAGSTVRNLNIALVSSVEVPLPPLPEQQRIVSILDEAFAAIAKAKANAEQNLKNAKELFESYLQGVFENGNYQTLEFGEVCELVGGSQPSKEHFIYEPKDGYIRLIQVRDYRTDKFITYIPKSLAKRFCDKEDIMIGRYGPPIFGIFKGLEGAYNVALMKAVVNEKLCDRTYFYWFLQNNKIREFVEQSSKRAVGQDGVRKELLEKYPVPVPSLKEQQTIVRQLDALRVETQKLEAVYQKKIDDLEELKKSILQKAFAGELKTSQEVV